MIRPAVLLTALCLLAGPALAQDRSRAVRPPANLKDATVKRWIKTNVDPGDFFFVSYNEEAAYFLEPALNQVPSLSPRRLWLRVEWFKADAEGVRSRRLLYEFDCAEQRSRLLAIDTFGALNLIGPLESADVDLDTEAQWEYQRPDTQGEDVLREACAMQHPLLTKPAGGAP